MKSEIRNPKSERSPNSETGSIERTDFRGACGVRAIYHLLPTRFALSVAPRGEFRISGFGFVSDFGFRISDFSAYA